MENVNDALRDAVINHNVKIVQDCLNRGADPNYAVVIVEDAAEDYNQPTTPLKLVVFCISDNMLKDDDLKQFAKITALLISNGADPKPAMQLAETRYGKYNPNHEKSPFMDVWHIIANAK